MKKIRKKYTIVWKFKIKYISSRLKTRDYYNNYQLIVISNAPKIF